MARCRRPKLLFVATEDWFFASHFLPMARAARELGFDVAVIARERNHRRIIEATGARLIALEAERRSLDPRALFRQITALKALIAAEKPDILHCIALKPIALAGLAGKLAGVDRRVYALTGLGFLGAKQGVLAAAARFAAIVWLRGAIDGPQRPLPVRESRRSRHARPRSAGCREGCAGRRGRCRSADPDAVADAERAAAQGCAGGAHALVEGRRSRGRGGQARPR